MKKIIFIVVLISVIAVSLGCKNNGKVKLSNRQDSLSYALGLQVGDAMHKSLTVIDYKMFVRAMKDAADTSKIALTDQQIQSLMMTYKVETQMKMEQKKIADSKKNKEAQEKFLAKNAKNPGIKLIEGMQYKVIKEGTGIQPTEKDSVQINFVGKTFEGKEIMNSKESPTPIVVSFNMLFPSWNIALKNMKEGAKWEIYPPDSLAFGDQPVGELGPNQGVMFELELVKVIKK